jgi:hypothetical protein
VCARASARERAGVREWYGQNYRLRYACVGEWLRRACVRARSSRVRVGLVRCACVMRACVGMATAGGVTDCSVSPLATSCQHRLSLPSSSTSLTSPVSTAQCLPVGVGEWQHIGAAARHVWSPRACAHVWSPRACASVLWEGVCVCGGGGVVRLRARARACLRVIRG